MHQHDRILIVGGGIGGLTLAASLHKLGMQAEVYEQAEELREVGAGVGLWTNALQSLDQIGAGDEIREKCVPLHRAEILNHRAGVLASLDFQSLGSEFAQAACYIAHRATLLAAIQRRVPSAWIHTGCRAVEIAERGSSVHVRFENGRMAEGSILVGADGLRSLVRTHNIGDSPLRYSGQTCFRGLAPVSPQDPGVIREIQGAGKRCAVCPISRDLVYWWAALNAGEGSIIPAFGRQAFLSAQYRGWPCGFSSLVANTPSENILQNDLLDRAPIRSWSRGRITLLGDAAHPTTPNLGQGANMAIDDAIVLARSLVRAGNPSQAFQLYESERMERTSRIVTRSWRFGSLARWETPGLVWLREAIARYTPATLLKAELRHQILDSVGALD